MDERVQFVARRLAGEQMADLCREFGISRKTGYKIFDRYKECGVEGLTDRSRRPHHYAHKLPFQVENYILNVKREHGSLNENAASSLSDLPYVNEIIELGGISIGIVPPPTECVAIAHEGKNTLAILVRRKGETLTQLLTRLALAIGRAQTEDVFTDEVNQAGFHRP